MEKTIRRIKAGGGRIEDLDVMLHLANNLGIMPGTTICGLADGAAWPIKNAVTKFRAELEEYIRSHQTPSAQPTPLQISIAQGRPIQPAPGGGLPVLNGPAPARALHAPGGLDV
jgi:NADH-quinone oxidoreductase subunit F